MCGISICLDLQERKRDGRTKPERNEQEREKLQSQLDCSVESMRHRGPNAKGIWISSDNSVGLGHVRLSTRDLSSAGDQPLHSADDKDDIHVVVNGELYYDANLRASLAKEYTFQSTSDSEMLIALYKRYGTALTDHLRGEFSLAIYDGSSRTLVAIRDRFGVKPLHFGVFDGRLLIATQAKGIVELLDNKQSLCWDVQCLAQGGGHYGNRTLFKGIKKFPPGNMLVVHQGQTHELEFNPYFRTKYTANQGGKDNRPADELIEELRKQLVESVRLRFDSSDVPVGILLSGGVDSSAVAGITAAIGKERIALIGNAARPLPICFTIGFPDDDDLDESSIARRTAEDLGLPFEKVVVTEQILADEFEEACWRGETLLWDLQHIAKKALSRYISRRGLKVVLNGDGSDELFGGYPYFVADRLLMDDRRRSTSLQEVDGERREELRQEHAKNVQWFGMEDTEDQHMDRKARALRLPPAFSNLAVVSYDDCFVDEVRNLSDPFQAIYECFSAKEVEEMKTYHPMHRAMLAWTKTVLPNVVIAAISDGAEMAHGVESRPPFLDHIVAELSYTFSVDMLVHLEGDQPPVEKWIFREAVKPYVSEEVYSRRKHAFAAPFKWEAGGPLYVKLSSLITRENVERMGFIDWNKCADLVDRAFLEKDQLLFRQAIWLAQIVSMGIQFGVQTWTSSTQSNIRADKDLNSPVVSSTELEVKAMVNGQTIEVH